MSTDHEQRAALVARGMSPDTVLDVPLAVGIEVAQIMGQQDNLDPHRPTLPRVVADAIERRAALGRRAGDGQAEALRERIAQVIEQREQLAAVKAQQAREYLAAGNYAAGASHASWAASLAADAAALRSVLG